MEQTLGFEQGLCKTVTLTKACFELVTQADSVVYKPRTVLGGLCRPDRARVVLKRTAGSLEWCAVNLHHLTDAPVVIGEHDGQHLC